MPSPHFYSSLDTDPALTLEIDMRALVERIVGLNHGTHRFLSHLIDVLREKMQCSVATYGDRGDVDVANYIIVRDTAVIAAAEALLDLV